MESSTYRPGPAGQSVPVPGNLGPYPGGRRHRGLLCTSSDRRTMDLAFLSLILSSGTAGWIVVYSITLLKRTRPLQKIFGPIPEDEWEAATLVIRDELAA